MLKETAKIPLEGAGDKKKVTLIEKKQRESDVLVNGLPDDTVVVKVDAFRSAELVFVGSRGECRRADYAIFADSGKKKVIIYIEMTVSSKSESERIQQLKGAKCFIGYCQEIAQEFWNRRGFLKDFQFRYVSIGRIGINKRKTRIERNTGKHDTPEKMLKISWPHYLEFNRLAGKR